jgi:hypothetical protein
MIVLGSAPLHAIVTAPTEASLQSGFHKTPAKRVPQVGRHPMFDDL